MIDKSALRATLKDKLDEHEIEGNDLLEDLMDGLVQDFGDDIYDDEDESDEEDETPSLLGD
jgi:hypothetical protein